MVRELATRERTSLEPCRGLKGSQKRGSYVLMGELMTSDPTLTAWDQQRNGCQSSLDAAQGHRPPALSAQGPTDDWPWQTQARDP